MAFVAVTAVIALIIALFASLAKGPPFKVREFAWLAAGAWALVLVVSGVLFFGWLVDAILTISAHFILGGN